MRIGAEIGTGGEAVAMTVPYGLAGEPIVDALPTAVVAAFALLTRLADTAVLFGVAALYYWLADGRYDDDPRVTGATLFGIAALTLAAVTLAKAALALPRPPTAATPVAFDGLPGSLAAAVGDATVADGFGLPSGHAAGAVALYGGLARLLDRPVPRRRLAAAAVVIGLVAASRVVIGVHYVADVVAGLAVGLGCLVGGRRLAVRAGGGRADPTVLFLLAAAASLATVAVAAAGGHPAEVTGGAVGIATGLGGAAGWRVAAPDAPAVPPGRAVLALPVLGGGWAAPLVLSVGPAAAAAISLPAAAAVLLLPSVGGAGVRGPAPASE